MDSTGLKLRGPGEWHVAKHGNKKRRIWKKLHIAVDGHGMVRATIPWRLVTDGHASDAAHVPALLEQVHEPIQRFIAAGAYDQSPIYEVVEGHSPGARVIIPPRKDAIPSDYVSSAPTRAAMEW